MPLITRQILGLDVEFGLVIVETNGDRPHSMPTILFKRNDQARTWSDIALQFCIKMLYYLLVMLLMSVHCTLSTHSKINRHLIASSLVSIATSHLIRDFNFFSRWFRICKFHLCTIKFEKVYVFSLSPVRAHFFQI